MTDTLLFKASHNLRLVAAVCGPGFVVMLADTETGSVITAAQSGATWGYRLLLLQFIIIPILYMVQELTVRLGLATGMGHGELILRRFGPTAAYLSIGTLLFSCFGALLTQLSGLAGVGQLFGVPSWQTVSAAVLFILTMMWTGSYQSVERVAIGLGLFELAFIVVAWRANPDLRQIGHELLAIPLSDAGYLYLLAANLGTSVISWSVFYQQSAIADKGLTLHHLKIARIETLFGAIFCQLVTAAVLVTAATTIGAHGNVGSLGSITEIAEALTTVLGTSFGRIIFALGLTGGALVATIVVCLTCAWSIGELAGFRHSLDHHPKEAPWFYLIFGILLIAAEIIVTSGVNLVRLSIGIGVMNALLLPVVLGFLYLLARSELPETLRLRGIYGLIVAAVFILTAGVGVYAGLVGAFG